MCQLSHGIRIFWAYSLRMVQLPVWIGSSWSTCQIVLPLAPYFLQFAVFTRLKSGFLHNVALRLLCLHISGNLPKFCTPLDDILEKMVNACQFIITVLYLTVADGMRMPQYFVQHRRHLLGHLLQFNTSHVRLYKGLVLLGWLLVSFKQLVW